MHGVDEGVDVAGIAELGEHLARVGGFPLGDEVLEGALAVLDAVEDAGAGFLDFLSAGASATGGLTGLEVFNGGSDLSSEGGDVSLGDDGLAFGVLLSENVGEVFGLGDQFAVFGAVNGGDLDTGTLGELGSEGFTELAVPNVIEHVGDGEVQRRVFAEDGIERSVVSGDADFEGKAEAVVADDFGVGFSIHVILFWV